MRGMHQVGRKRGWRQPKDVQHLDTAGRLTQILIAAALRAFTLPGRGGLPVISTTDTSPADLSAAFRVKMDSRGPVVEPLAPSHPEEPYRRHTTKAPSPRHRR